MQVTKVTEASIPMTPNIHKTPTPEALQREYDYYQSVKILQKMLDTGIITKEEFHKIDHLNRQSFSPLYASIMS